MLLCRSRDDNVCYKHRISPSDIREGVMDVNFLALCNLEGFATQVE